MILEEKTYRGRKEIHYLFELADWACPYLVVVFSAFGAPDAKEQHPYNYIHTFWQTR